MKNKFELFRKAVRALTVKEKVLVHFFGIVLIATISLYAWQSFDLTAGNDEVVEGGTYSEGLVGNVKIINPLYTDFNNVDRDISHLIFSGLTRYDPLSMDFVADLATYTLSDNEKKYTFTLRDGAKWHDGEPVTVDDVVFTYKDIIQDENFQNSVLKANFAGVEIKKENEKQVSFTLKEPNNYFITNTNVGIIPKHIFKDTMVINLMKYSSGIKPIGTGPYTVESGPKDNGDLTTVTLKRFEDYYGEKPKIEKVRFLVYPAAELLFENISQVHGIPKLSYNDLDKIEDEDRFELYEYSLPQYMAVFFNFDSDMMKNKNMRIAAMKAIDKNEILSEIKGKENIDNPLLDLDQSEWYFKPNLEEAKGALYNLGWNINKEDQTDLIRTNSKGEKLVLTLITHELPTGHPAQIETEKLIKIMKEQWLKAGIEIRDEYYILPELEEKIKNREYDMLLTGVNMGYNLDIYAYWHSSQAKPEGLNFCNFRSFEADAIIENLRQTFVQNDKYEETLKKLRKVIADDFPAVFLYSPKFYAAIDNRVNNVNIKNLAFPADRFAYFSNWYIKEKR